MYMRSSAQYESGLAGISALTGRGRGDPRLMAWESRQGPEKFQVRILSGVDTVDKANGRRQRLGRTARGVGRVTGRQVSISLRRRWHGGQAEAQPQDLSCPLRMLGGVCVCVCVMCVIDRPRISSRGDAASVDRGGIAVWREGGLEGEAMVAAVPAFDAQARPAT